MKLYDLSNPSDPYTFYAPSIEIAGVCVVLINSGYGATPIDGNGESSPIMFGWDEWFSAKGIDEKWIDKNKIAIADALDSFLIGTEKDRKDVESHIELLSEDAKKEWLDKQQDKIRGSLNKIGEKAYGIARQLRKQVEPGKKTQ